MSESMSSDAGSGRGAGRRVAGGGRAGRRRRGSKRPSVAVMDFDFGTVERYGTGGATTTSARAWPTRSWTRWSNDGTFRVIERKKLDTVLAEQDFARSDRADPSAAKLSKIGKVLGVKYIIAGSITKFGGEEKNYGGGGARQGQVGGLG